MVREFRIRLQERWIRFRYVRLTTDSQQKLKTRQTAWKIPPRITGRKQAIKSQMSSRTTKRALKSMKGGIKSYEVNSLLTSLIRSVRESIYYWGFLQTTLLHRSVNMKISVKYFLVQMYMKDKALNRGTWQFDHLLQKTHYNSLNSFNSVFVDLEKLN